MLSDWIPTLSLIFGGCCRYERAFTLRLLFLKYASVLAMHSLSNSSHTTTHTQANC